MSVLEVVRIWAQPGEGDGFQERLERGLAVQAEDPECTAIRIRRSIERPDEYLLELEWTSVEAHLAWQERARERWRTAVEWDTIGGVEGLKHYEMNATIK